MKKYLFILAFLAVNLSNVAQADPAYESAMKSQIQAMNEITDAQASAEVANAFLRIAEANSNEWLPLYYAALTKIEGAFRFDVNKDQEFDSAIELIQEASEISPNNSELTALHGYALMGKLSLDPVSRGQSMSPQVMQLFGLAINQDRENPRAVTLMAQMELGMAEFFGSGPQKACGMARIALDLYKSESAKIDESYIHPTWGVETAEELAKRCQ
ncbi:hypothetical protein E4S40_06925 [Algoriphagus kandeliae]|uniref:Tetratricopeptide repeat protein n=1 Tax=Algoriphagus kandeliae TaxID=2562278 RepID=A0A4Y9QTP4_9BACT|nr:hypothetical protein [Algoriphagus kandeliae]TFV95951.1 hypothetical protein E4S40_06925 [Algoriphagus kandeliae]